MLLRQEQVPQSRFLRLPLQLIHDRGHRPAVAALIELLVIGVLRRNDVLFEECLDAVTDLDRLLTRRRQHWNGHEGLPDFSCRVYRLPTIPPMRVSAAR